MNDPEEMMLQQLWQQFAENAASLFGIGRSEGRARAVRLARRKRTLAGLEPLEHRRVMAAGDLLRTIASPSTTAGARFGYSLSLSNETLLVGTPNGSGSGEGAAFTFDPASGGLLSKYSSTNPQFGYPSAISGDYLLVNEG